MTNEQLEAMRHRREWMDEVADDINGNLTVKSIENSPDPVWIERLLERQRSPYKKAIHGLPEADGEVVREETQRLAGAEKKLRAAITRKHKKLSDIRKAKKYREAIKCVPHLRPGELPPVFDNEKGLELLGRAVTAGLLTKEYQPTEGTTTAQLSVLARYVGSALGIRGKGFWLPFNRLWNKKSLENIKWQTKHNGSKYKRLLIVTELFPEYGFTPIVEQKVF